MEELFIKYLQVDKEFDGNFCLTKFEQINNCNIDDLFELKAFWRREKDSTFVNNLLKECGIDLEQNVFFKV